MLRFTIALMLVLSASTAIAADKYPMEFRAVDNATQNVVDSETLKVQLGHSMTMVGQVDNKYINTTLSDFSLAHGYINVSGSVTVLNDTRQFDLRYSRGNPYRYWFADSLDTLATPVYNDGTTSVYAVPTAFALPEPASIIMGIVGISGLALARRFF